MKKYLKAFTVGSSLVVFIWPLLLCYALSKGLSPATDYTFSLMAVKLAVLIGLLNAIYFAVRPALPDEISLRYWLYGLVVGLLLSVVGVFVYDLPTDVFEIPVRYQWLVAPVATLGYGVLWRYIIKNLNRVFNLEAG